MVSFEDYFWALPSNNLGKIENDTDELEERVRERGVGETFPHAFGVTASPDDASGRAP